MANDKPKIDLTIFLVKEGGDDSAFAVKNPDSLKQYEIDLSTGHRATLFVRNQKSGVPKWTSFFQDNLDAGIFGHNSSTGAVLAASLTGRTFLLTFGQGWHCIDSANIESDFGLKTSLNLLDPLSIRSIDKSSLEAQPKQLREQSGSAIEIQYFGIDIERDILRAVTGKPKDDSFGNRISGLDSLRLSLNIDLKDIPVLLDRLIKAYKEDSYKKGPFAWIDHIGQVRDSALKSDLDSELIKRLNDRELDDIWLSVPEIIDWNRVVGFRYSMGKRTPRVYDIRITDFLDTFNNEVVTDANLLHRKIWCVDEDDMQILERPAYYYIYAELPLDNEIFLLNNGHWYRVQDNYVKNINKSFEDITGYDKAFPIYDDKTEGEYNSRVADSEHTEYVLLDKNLAHISGAASPIEICDLYRNVKEFVHVKRYAGSSTLSHLFNQGMVSGELFQMNVDYRTIINGKLPDDRKIDDPTKRPEPHEYRVVYAIISENDDDSLSIPFFSKVSLKHCVSRLEAMGFCVMLAKISVANNRKILKTYRPNLT